MLSAHFLAVTPDGCPEEIEAGPFTEERARDALFAWEMNHGCPARVVCLVEMPARLRAEDMELVLRRAATVAHVSLSDESTLFLVEDDGVFAVVRDHMAPSCHVPFAEVVRQAAEAIHEEIGG